jgi:hypothetical protein
MYHKLRAANMDLVAAVFSHDQRAGFRQRRQFRFVLVLSVRQNDEWQRRQGCFSVNR